jgi:hypothetical protein
VAAFLPLLDRWDILAIPLSLGLALGFQTIHTKFGADSPRVLTTFTGWLYWLSRALVPVVAYAIWYNLQDVPRHHSLVTAALCGLGSELLLRSRFYFGERTQPDGKVEEVAKGVFDLVHWYQALCLKAAGDKLASERQQFIETLLAPESDFGVLAGRARSNAGAWAIQEEQQKLLALVADLEAKFNLAVAGLSGMELAKRHRAFILEFGYAAMRLVGRKSLRTFFK